jgi:hypothetical protein
MLNQLGLLPFTQSTLSHVHFVNTFLRYLGQPFLNIEKSKRSLELRWLFV